MMMAMAISRGTPIPTTMTKVNTMTMAMTPTAPKVPKVPTAKKATMTSRKCHVFLSFGGPHPSLTQY